MKANRLIRYRLCVSRYFPKGHEKEGLDTNFINSINSLSKIHTIRANYPLWEKRIKKVQEGKAVIELYYWAGKPYRSGHVMFKTIDKSCECGVQELIWSEDNSMCMRPRLYNTCEILNEEILAKNDGLELIDFKNWFKGYDFTKPMAIIHFTKFRY